MGCGLAIATVCLGIAVRATMHEKHAKLLFRDDDYEGLPRWGPSHIFDALRVFLFFCIAELDRIRCLGAKCQLQQLGKDFTSIQNSHCSYSVDELNLRQEIGDRKDVVDETIRVLTIAGMSTYSLRVASKHGVDLEGAAFMEYAWAMLMISMSVVGWYKLELKIYALFAGEHVGLEFFLNVANKLLAATFLFCLMKFSPDARVFACRVLQKAGALIACGPVLIVMTLFALELISYSRMERAVWCTLFLIWIITIPVSAAGIDRIARIPVCGHHIASVLAVRGCFGLPTHRIHTAWCERMHQDVDARECV